MIEITTIQHVDTLPVDPNKDSGTSPSIKGRARSKAHIRKALAHVGERYNNWLIVGISMKRNRLGSIRADARCTSCNKMYQPILSQVLHGTSKECDPCSRISRRGLKPYEHLYNSLKGQRGGAVIIDFSEYLKIVSLRICLWCGDDLHLNPHNKNRGCAWYVDRFDNEKDYELGNCVPCCSGCNYEKNDMTPLEWKERLVRTRGETRALDILDRVKTYLKEQENQ